MNLKVRDAMIIAFGVVVGLIVAAAPAEFIRMAVMRWDVLWFMHEDMMDSPHFTIPCPSDGSDMKPLDLKDGDRIKFFDMDERTT